MEFIDYYRLLEIEKNASEADIKKAYRRLARKYHPDLNPGDAAANLKFQQINEANEVLSHPENRKKYDQYGQNWQHGEAQQNAHKSRQDSSSGSNHFSDFFESMFGGQERRSGSTRFRGQDIQATLELDLRDVFETHKRTLTIQGKSIRLTIPAGVENGQQIKISNQGGAGINGGPAGDLYVEFKLNNSSPFERIGNNLLLQLEVDLYTALLGGEILVSTFDGKRVKLKVAPETQTGTQVKLRGKGFPVYKQEGHFGDLLISYHVKLPTKLTAEEKELIVQLSKLRNHGN